ncbi:MAG: hypothetical protein ACOX7F_07495 [Eubacteriales bacterium]|jgi:hypothetical protein
MKKWQADVLWIIAGSVILGQLAWELTLRVIGQMAYQPGWADSHWPTITHALFNMAGLAVLILLMRRRHPSRRLMLGCAVGVAVCQVLCWAVIVLVQQYGTFYGWLQWLTSTPLYVYQWPSMLLWEVPPLQGIPYLWMVLNLACPFLLVLAGVKEPAHSQLNENPLETT